MLYLQIVLKWLGLITPIQYTFISPGVIYLTGFNNYTFGNLYPL